MLPRSWHISATFGRSGAACQEFCQQLLRYHIVPGCIGFYATWRPSVPLALQLGRTAVIEAGSRCTQRAGATPASTPAAATRSTPSIMYHWPSGQVAPGQAATVVAPQHQARTWQQPAGQASYTGVWKGSEHGLDKQVGVTAGRRLLQDCPWAGRPLRLAQLQNNQLLHTALEGAAPLLVDAKDRNDIEVIPSDQNEKAEDADILVADISAGMSIIHIVDEVLVPASLRKN